jgi:predicted nucleic acid-binding protein
VGDFKAFGEALAEDVELHIHGFGPLDGTWRGRSEVVKATLSPQDAWIAATALGLDASLATNNRSDFDHIQNLRLVSP